jgi:cell division inhibitor SepF
VTPLRRSKHGVSDVNEILTVHPKKYDDAKFIAETFREGIPVIINLTQMSESEARRLVDFASGLSQGLYGHIERVTAKVFLLSPSHVLVSGEGDGVESELDASLVD